MKLSFLARIVCLFHFGILAASCSGSAELSSSWSKEPVAIDGAADEWTSRLYPMKDTKNLVGVQNDQDFVYVCFVSQEERFNRQIMIRGLVVWFESENGGRLGVHYPLGDQSHQDLEILGPGKDEHHMVSILEIPGISANVGVSKGSVVYELKVPLKQSADWPYAVGAAPGSTLKLRIESAKFEPGERHESGMGEGRGGGMGGGSRGGRRGGRGGPPGGGGGRSGGEGSGEAGSGGGRPEPLEFKGEVHLAGSPSGN